MTGSKFGKRRRLGRRVSAELNPFLATVDSYVGNLLACTTLPSRASVSDCDLLVAIADPPPGPDGRQAEVEIQKRLRAYARKWAPAQPAAPSEPAQANLHLLGDLFDLSEVERGVLQFALAHIHSVQFREVTCVFGELTLAAASEIIAVAIQAPSSKVHAALQDSSRLVGAGLVETDEELVPMESKVYADSFLRELALTPDLDRKKVMETLLSVSQEPKLAWADFDHLREAAATARDLLAASLRAERRGTNILFYGPTGTGKTELARVLAREVGVPLYAAGYQGDHERTKGNRLQPIRFANRLVGSTKALLLFDELEDLFDWEFAGLAATKYGSALMSKWWFNDLLETNQAPTIWITNEVDGIDPAFLRRFTYAVEFPPLSARQRARVLGRHLGETKLPANDVEAIARRFEASPAQIGTAVAAAALLANGAPDRAAIERVLEPVVKLVTGARPRQVDFEPSGYRVDALNSPDDLVGIVDQLAQWKAGLGLGISMCLYGPPGTGKSEFVKYAAYRMDRRIVYRRVSDLISMWVGQSEKNIARAFREAEEDDAVLLFDEADSFLRDRQHARASWEVTQVNEFLHQLESHRGVVACTTNLWRDLDAASLRRFVFKIEFRAMRPEQSLAMFRSVFVDDIALHGQAEEAELAVELGRMLPLTPGDFAAVARRLRAIRRRPTVKEALMFLRAEAAARGMARERIGF